jgi:hypothetical protein
VRAWESSRAARGSSVASSRSALSSSGDHGESQTIKYERDTDLTTWIRADGCSRWLRTARMSWLVLAAQKVAPSVQTIEDAKRDKLIQADIERQ